MVGFTLLIVLLASLPFLPSTLAGNVTAATKATADLTIGRDIDFFHVTCGCAKLPDHTTHYMTCRDAPAGYCCDASDPLSVPVALSKAPNRALYQSNSCHMPSI